jgi:selenocysteine lyase/cysteine desulfurase
MSLKAGIEFVNQYKRENIYKHETRLCNILINELSGISDVIIYRNKNLRYVPIVAFNIKGRTSEETAELLNREGFCLRAGLHCAPLAHRTLGTPDGVVRFSPSVFSRENDVVRLCRTIRKLVVSG